jgi:ATP-dependent RNA helicase DDX24/MAK5
VTELFVRFKAREVGVMIATDVAARGLDIKAIDHVIHYQLPRHPDTYVHRCGRTARAAAEGMLGIWLMLCSRNTMFRLFIIFLIIFQD